MSRNWYDIKASSRQNETEVLIYDEIGGFGVSASAFVAALGQVPKNHRLLLRIHSPGGSVLDGNAIVNAIKNHPGGVTTQIDGLAASMAGVIAIAGEPVRMASNALLMIHNVTSYAEGDPGDLRRMADLAEKIQEGVVDAYAARTGIAKYKIRDMMDAETWMDAKEAKEMGFVDELTEETKMAASFDLTRFRNAPKPVVFNAQIDNAKKDMSEPVTISQEEKSFLSNLFSVFTGKAAQPADPVAVITAELSGVRATLATITEARDAALSTITVLTAERDEAVAKLETPEAREAAIAAEVNARLSAAGIDPIRRDPKAGAGATITDELAAIKEPGERTRFVNKNRAALYAEANAAKSAHSAN